MRSPTAALLLVALACARAPARTPLQAAAADGAERLGRAALTGDFETAVALFHPGLVALLGGPERAREVVRGMDAGLRADGGELHSFRVLEVSDVVPAGDELHAVVTCELLLAVDGQLVRSTSPMVAVSADDGASWTYVNPGDGGEPMLRRLLSSWDGTLSLPAPEGPTPVEE